MSWLEYASPEVPQGLSRRDLALRAVELGAAFFASPLLLYYRVLPMRFLMPMLLAAALWALWLIRKFNPSREELGLGEGGVANLRPVVIVGLGLWLMTLAVTLALGRPGAYRVPVFFEHPIFIVIICVIYPASAAAQEVLFRAFFFWRYKALMPLWGLALLNVMSFGWIHMVFESWISVALSAAAGGVLTALYLWRRSLGGVVIVHSMLGLSAFFAGYGQYFYHAAVK